MTNRLNPYNISKKLWLYKEGKSLEFYVYSDKQPAGCPSVVSFRLKIDRLKKILATIKAEEKSNERKRKKRNRRNSA